jgi:hypothetical protein
MKPHWCSNGSNRSSVTLQRFRKYVINDGTAKKWKLIGHQIACSEVVATKNYHQPSSYPPERLRNIGGRVDVMSRTYEELVHLSRKQNIPGVRIEQVTEPVITNDEEAQQLGRIYNAQLVIWGWRDSAGAFVQGTRTDTDAPEPVPQRHEIELLNPTTVPVCLSREAPAQGSYSNPIRLVNTGPI